MITYLIRRLINGCHVWVRVTTSLATWRAIPRAVGVTILCAGAPPAVMLPEPAPVPVVARPRMPAATPHGWTPGTVWTIPAPSPAVWHPVARPVVYAPPVHVPEPGMAVVLGLAVAALAAFRRIRG